MLCLEKEHGVLRGREAKKQPPTEPLFGEVGWLIGWLAGLIGAGERRHGSEASLRASEETEAVLVTRATAAYLPLNSAW